MQETKPDLPLFDTEYVKELKTFSIHETNQTVVSYFKKAVLKYKHLENMLNIILNKEISRIYSAGSVEKEENSSNKEKVEKTNPEKDFTYFNLLTNPMIIKAVLSGNEGGEKTQQSFYQIPFGKFLNYIEEKAFNYGIKVITIDESINIKQTAKRLFKLCNPIQLKSANEFEELILKRSGLN